MKNLVLNEKTQRVSIFDNRFYVGGDGQFFPGVTTVLDAYPKGAFYSKWLKELGTSADQVIQKALELGSEVHNAIDDLTKGRELTYIDTLGNNYYSYEGWVMIEKFVQFAKYIKIISSEQVIVSESRELGGTVDLICEIEGETWLIDYKTSKAIYKTNELQLAIYRKMLEESGIKIDRHGVLWLNAATRTDKGYTQGKGWQLKEFTDSYAHDLKLFEITHQLWLEENDKYNPKNIEFSNTLKL